MSSLNGHFFFKKNNNFGIIYISISECDIKMYYLIIFLFLLDILIIYIDPIILKRNKEKLKKKIEASKIIIKESNNLIEYETYPQKVLTYLKGENISIDVEYINIKEESRCSCLILKNVKKIFSFNVDASTIVFKTSNYIEKDGIVYDLNNKVCFFIKKMKIKELINVVQKSNISKALLDKFSNSTYFQFVPSKGLLRLSLPYYEKDKKVRAVIPNQIEGINIETVEINCQDIDFIYIGRNVKRIILEQNVLFNKIKIDDDNKYIKIRDNKLVYRVFNTYIHPYGEKNIVKDSTNFAYLPQKHLSKKCEKCQKGKK